MQPSRGLIYKLLHGERELTLTCDVGQAASLKRQLIVPATAEVKFDCSLGANSVAASEGFTSSLDIFTPSLSIRIQVQLKSLAINIKTPNTHKDFVQSFGLLHGSKHLYVGDEVAIGILEDLLITLPSETATPQHRPLFHSRIKRVLRWQGWAFIIATETKSSKCEIASRGIKVTTANSNFVPWLFTRGFSPACGYRRGENSLSAES